MTLDDILSAPGNRPLFEELSKLLRDDRAIAFVGAGASAGMYPLWSQLIEMLADHAVREGKAGSKDAVRWKADMTSTPQQRVNNILRKLGQPTYCQFLKEVFSPHRGPDGRFYTPIHAALLRLPFLGYVTTNYDAALDFARVDCRPGCINTGTPTWQDDDEVYRWLTGDILREPDTCPVLWLHGHWQRPQGIVLNMGEFAQAYKPGLYRKTFERLWQQDHLVFVGYGFMDPLFAFIVSEIMRDIAGVQAEPRHIALLGFKGEDSSRIPSDDVLTEWRESMEADYHVRVLFYPVIGRNHSALQLLLEGIEAACVPATPVPRPLPARPASNEAPLPTRWVHETTNDSKFTGRDDELDRLNRWVCDSAVRIIGVCAVGGGGKTALIGHWLKNTTGWRRRPFAGLFAWSFYQDRNTTTFLREFARWATETLGATESGGTSDLLKTAINILQAQPVVIILDGLEVVQEGPDESRHGSFLDRDLRGLLVALCQRQHQSLAVLTSRFIFADLDRHAGTAFHQLELQGLPEDQGGSLLAGLNVGGSRAEREGVSHLLDGHPLGLRIFADALPDANRDQPRGFLECAFSADALPQDARLGDKVRRLLAFYEKQLSSVQVQLLSVIALFHTAVAEDIVFRLMRGMFGDRSGASKHDDAALSIELGRLHSKHVLTREPFAGGTYGTACHPVLRDHFRGVLLAKGATAVRRAADLLMDRPSAEMPAAYQEIEPAVLAIELLLEAGDFESADSVFRSRLDYGWVFVNLPALQEGLRCALLFVGDDARQKACQEKLGSLGLRYHLSWAALYAGLSGHLDLALQFYSHEAIGRDQSQNILDGVTGTLYEAEILIFAGQLYKAQTVADLNARLEDQSHHRGARLTNRAISGWANALAGRIENAVYDLLVADRYDVVNSGASLYGGAGVALAELLVRTGHVEQARMRTEQNLRLCERKSWNDDVGKCHWILGWCALAEGDIHRSEIELLHAESIFREGDLLFWLARVQITEGFVAVAQGDVSLAFQYAEDALALAAPRGIRLMHADALLLRGRTRLLVGGREAAERAEDDSQEARRLARESGYAWAERDALLLLSDALMSLATSDPSKADRCRGIARQSRDDAETLAAKLRLTGADLAASKLRARWLSDRDMMDGER